MKKAPKSLLSPRSDFYGWLCGHRKATQAEQQTNRALFICFFGHPQTRRSYIIHNFSFNKKVPFMLRFPPSPLAAHKTPIPSCKAICLETLCGGHPCLSRAPACWWLFQSFLTGWQAEWSRAHSPRPQASPSLPESSVHVCSSSPWFL